MQLQVYVGSQGCYPPIYGAANDRGDRTTVRNHGPEIDLKQHPYNHVQCCEVWRYITKPLHFSEIRDASCHTDVWFEHLWGLYSSHDSCKGCENIFFFQCSTKRHKCHMLMNVLCLFQNISPLIQEASSVLQMLRAKIWSFYLTSFCCKAIIQVLWAHFYCTMITHKTL